MSGEITERTFFVGNHPSTGEMYKPILELLFRYPNTSIVSGKIWSLLPHLDVIPAESSKYLSESPIKHAVEKIILSTFGSRIPETDVLSEIHKRIEKNRNVLIFPAGGPAKEEKERRWHIGLATALLQSAESQPKVSFVHLRNGKIKYAQPFASSEVLDSDDPYAVIKLLWQRYVDTFSSARE